MDFGWKKSWLSAALDIRETIPYPLSVTSQDREKTIRQAIFRYVDPATTMVFLFGSRAYGTHRPASDYDIGLYSGQRIPWPVLSHIQGDLEESDVPVTVDVVDFMTVTPDFKALALKKINVWNPPPKNLKLM